MTVKHNTMKTLTLTVGTDGTGWEGQISNYQVVNGTGDPSRFWTFGEAPTDTDAQSFTEAADDEWSFQFTAYTDWSTTGLSKWIYDNDGQIVSMSLDHLPGVTGQHIVITGQVQVKAGNVGGDVKTPEAQTYTFAFQNKPTIAPGA